MLTAAGHSVAMGESRSELIEAVEYVTTPLYKDGIENALKHYNLV
ncbi:MAG: HAD hydrolase family protein, partial [Clostridia bacterium]|nr:HAD hydrolase family protein [Clostridia bacterium]